MFDLAAPEPKVMELSERDLLSAPPHARFCWAVTRQVIAIESILHCIFGIKVNRPAEAIKA